ncbi:MAG: GIY-YIG nuclease family protein [Chitinophagaceae bacterium]|nr:GIY-YIG nuclease family protein [Chitinophagaceae bacterium]
MFYVYALKSVERNYIYVGLTENIKRRFADPCVLCAPLRSLRYHTVANL